MYAATLRRDNICIMTTDTTELFAMVEFYGVVAYFRIRIRRMIQYV